MITARGKFDGKEMIVIGITDENVADLKKGQAMVMDSTRHEAVPDGWVVVIAYGKTQLELFKALQPAINEATRTIRQ